MDYQELVAIQLSRARGQLTQWNPHRVLHGACGDFSGLPDVKNLDTFLFLFEQFSELLDRDLRDIIQLVAAGDPANNSVFEIRVDLLDADASQPELRFP